MLASPHIYLFLNIEGTVCPRGSAGLVLCAEETEALQRVWCWAKPLEDISDELDLRLVLRSSWTLQIPVERIAQCMSPNLRRTLAGYTEPIAELRLSGARRIATPYQVITRYCAKHGVKYWCALDDREKEWPAEHRWRLVKTDPKVGLSDDETVMALKTAISWLAFERDKGVATGPSAFLRRSASNS